MNEQAIQSKILSHLKRTGIYSAKIIKANNAGTPDILACMPIKITKAMVGKTIGAFFAIEVKAVNGKESPLQEYHKGLITQCGGKAIVARSVDDVLKTVFEASLK